MTDKHAITRQRLTKIFVDALNTVLREETKDSRCERDAAGYLGCSRMAIRSYRSLGFFPGAIKLSGRLGIQYPNTELDEFKRRYVFSRGRKLFDLDTRTVAEFPQAPIQEQAEGVSSK